MPERMDMSFENFSKSLSLMRCFEPYCLYVSASSLLKIERWSGNRRYIHLMILVNSVTFSLVGGLASL